jgi:hypothetical protein
LTATNSIRSDKGIPFGSKSPERKADTPGPSSYQINYSFVKCASIALTITKAKRDLPYSKIVKETPGPGYYGIESHKVIAK